ncbi:MAG: hypothetical protein ABJH72_19225 [Reichenbachiella sp.]|uniref:hypothetical protein n=1 Tax=Reichenbachiella sp. TaxID=2184521 RepID=UPI003267D329
MNNFTANFSISSSHFARVTLVSLIFLLTLSHTGLSQEVDMLKNGFSLKLHMSSYGKESGDDTGFGLEFGNQWYISRFQENKIGVAILVNWLDFSIASRTEEFFGNETKYVLFNGSIIELGPLITYKINENMALDTYFQGRPTVYYIGIDTDSGFDENEDDPGGTGLTYALGFSYRYKVFYAGLEFGFGKVKEELFDSSAASYKVDNTRFSIGFKF